jgi:hypothetical protein
LLNDFNSSDVVPVIRNESIKREGRREKGRRKGRTRRLEKKIGEEDWRRRLEKIGEDWRRLEKIGEDWRRRLEKIGEEDEIEEKERETFCLMISTAVMLYQLSGTRASNPFLAA